MRNVGPNSGCLPLQEACYGTGILEDDCPATVQSICAGGITRDPANPSTPPTQSPCEQDEGGPLVLNKANAAAPLSGAVSEDRLVGVASWVRCACVLLVLCRARACLFWGVIQKNTKAIAMLWPTLH